MFGSGRMQDVFQNWGTFISFSRMGEQVLRNPTELTVRTCVQHPGDQSISLPAQPYLGRDSPVYTNIVGTHRRYGQGGEG